MRYHQERHMQQRLGRLEGLARALRPQEPGRQRVRMQQLLQPKKPEYVSQTAEAAERWEYDIQEYET